MAADCIAQPGYVEARLRAHRDGAAVVAGAMVNAHPQSRSAAAAYLLLHRRRTPDTPAGRAGINPSSFDRAALASVGPFREDLRTGEDTELLRRLPTGLVRWAPEVRVAHRYPTSPRAFLRDQIVRGRRRVTAERELSGVDLRRRLARDAMGNAMACVRQVRRTDDEIERRQLERAIPLLLPGAIAYAIGALLAPPARIGSRFISRGSRARGEGPRAAGRSPR